MATKSITKKQLIELKDVLGRINYSIKNLITRRCEKLAKKLNDSYLVDLQEELDEIDEELCVKDKSGVSEREELVITDKAGTSQRGNTGALKFTHTNKIKRKEKLNMLMEETISIPIYVIPCDETNQSLYQTAFELYAFTTLSLLSGIILDIPLDDDGFITDEFADKYMSPENKDKKLSATNGVGKKEEVRN